MVNLSWLWGGSPVEGAKAPLCENFTALENGLAQVLLKQHSRLVLLGLSELMYVLGSATCDLSH